jgi:predicted MFS family arabinose efflux permease
MPIFLLALPAGALADVIDRRRLLLFSQGWMLLAAAALGLLTLEGVATPLAVLALSFALGVGVALNAPAWQAIVPELVGRDELTAAIALNGINFNLARAVGPALGGLIVSLMGAGATFLLNAMSFLGVMAVLYQWRHEHHPGVLPAERVVGAMRTGLRYVRYAPPLRAVLVCTAAFVVGGSAMWALLALLARNQLGMDASGYGGMLACFGVGGAVGGLLVVWAGERVSRDRILAAASVVFAAMSAGLFYCRAFTLVYALMVAGGAAWVVAMSQLNVAAQLSVPKWVQGRALSCYQIVMQGGMAVTSVLWGELAERIGIPDALLCAAVAQLLGMAALLRYSIAGADELELDPMPPVPMPKLAEPVPPEAGPVMVTVEYAIDPERAREFEETMLQLRIIRRRDGANFWGLFFDAERPERYVEYFVVDSWMEHMRQHRRGTLADQDIFEHARSFQIGDGTPAVRHQIAADMIRKR